MGLFQKMCRNLGLMVHGIKKPIQDDVKSRGTKHVTKREVEEEQIDENIILRRTIVEEIEMKPGANKDKLKAHQQNKKSDA